jgi:ribosome maturation factor RimP
MNSYGNSKNLKEALGKIVESCGLECVWIEISDARSAKVLRIYIDSHGGVGHPECELVSRRVGEYFDSCEEEGRVWFTGKYFVEVSSPGIERPLFTPESYKRFAGSRVRVVTKNRKKHEGAIGSCEEGVVSINSEDGPVICVALSDIKTANLVYEPQKGEKKSATHAEKSGNTKKSKEKDNNKSDDSRTA